MVTPQQVMWIEWSTLIVTYTLVGMRVAVRVAMRQKHLLISDVLLLLAALCILGLDICDTITYRMGAMGNLGMISEALLKVQFATSYLFDIGMYFPKLSMLAFYFRLIPLHEVLLRRALYILTAVVAAFAVVTLTLRTFWCGRNPSDNWSTDSTRCSSFKSITLIQINWVLCFTSELLIFILPFPLLPHLRALVGRERLGLVLVFTLGAITLITSIGRFAFILSGTFNVSVYLWPNAEFSVSIIVVACTALRPLVRKFCSCTLPRRALSGNVPLPFSLAHITFTKNSAKLNTPRHSMDIFTSRDVADAEAGPNYPEREEALAASSGTLPSETHYMNKSPALGSVTGEG